MSSQVPAETRKRAGIVGIRCSLTLDDRDSAAEFIRLLNKQFSHDPDVLFVVVHAYSDLSTRTAQDLGRTAPHSVAAHKLNAEALEMQGRWEPAQLEYEGILEKEPNAPGIHFLLGRLLLSKPDAGPEAAERAKQEFLKEIAIDPKNAGAQYILGNLPGVTKNVMRPSLDFRKRANWMPISGKLTWVGSLPCCPEALRRSYTTAGSGGAHAARQSRCALQPGGGFKSYREKRRSRERVCDSAPVDTELAAGRSQAGIGPRSAFFWQEFLDCRSCCNPTRRDLLRGIAAWALAGAYPQIVPAAFPPGEFPFEQIPASASGISWRHSNGKSPEKYLPETTGAGCAFLDYDNDGWMDIYLVNSGKCDFYSLIRRSAMRCITTIGTEHLAMLPRKRAWRLEDSDREWLWGITTGTDFRIFM